MRARAAVLGGGRLGDIPPGGPALPGKPPQVAESRQSLGELVGS